MIENGFAYITVLIVIASLVVYAQEYYKWKIFEYLPAIVIIYFTAMVFSTLGVWQKSVEITATYKSVKSNILPAMIFLLLLHADLRQIRALGIKMVFTFLLATVSIAIGFIGMFAFLEHLFEPDAWRAFSALCGSWMGGTANMVAIQSALAVPDSKMGYALLIDSINYSVYIMLLLALVPLAHRFNHWSNADTSTLETVGQKLSLAKTTEAISFHSLFLLLGMALLVSVISQTIAPYLPINNFVTTNTWVVIITTIIGIIFAMTPFGKMAGSSELGNILLYLMVALIASRANFSELTQAPLYVVAGFMIIAIHGIIMLVFAKIFKLDLFTLGVASLANIGGVASAPILAGAYSKSLIPIGVLMAMMGYILGTFGGLAVGKAMQMIAG